MPTFGIERTKTGPGSKTRAIIIPDGTCLQIVLGIGVFFVMLMFYVVQVKNSMWAEKHALMDDKLKAENFAHEAATTIMKLTVDLEAHIAHEIEWNRMEQQMVERHTELQENSRININNIVFESLKNLDNFVETEVMNVDQELVANVHSVLNQQQDLMNKRMNEEFDEYMKQTHELYQAYLDTIQEETDKNKSGMQAIHKLLTKFAARAGVGRDSETSDHEIDDKLKGFFTKVEKTFSGASELKLPKEVVTKIEQLQKDFKMTAVGDIVKRMNALLFPGGANEGASLYGVKHYTGGSLEAYLENILFLDRFTKKLYPELEKRMEKWEAKELDSFELLDDILRMVESGELPATWLMG